MNKKVPAVLLFCLFAVPTFAQSMKEVRDKNYQKLFTITGGFFEKLPKTCKTEACAALATTGAALVVEGQDKHTRDVFTPEERTAWHAKLQSTLLGSIHELQSDLARKHLKTVPTAALMRPTCAKPAGYLATDECGLCYDVLEQVVEICALYAFVSPEAANHPALICIAWAALNFGGCINNWCTSTFNLN